MSGIEMGKKLYSKFEEMFPDLAKDAVTWKLNTTKEILVKDRKGKAYIFNYQDDSNYSLTSRKGI